jgi:hypothetical protein
MEKVSSIEFYNAWINSVNKRKDDLLKVWRINPKLTKAIKDWDNSVVSDIAQELNLLIYPQDYYSIDTIFYKKEDKTPGIPDYNYWFRNIRVAFEHENVFNKVLEEVSHLTITNCDLRVLVTYPPDDLSNESVRKRMMYLHEIIAGNRQSDEISENESFLIIFGFENGFEWQGYIYKNNEEKWKRI